MRFIWIKQPKYRVKVFKGGILDLLVILEFANGLIYLLNHLVHKLNRDCGKYSIDGDGSFNNVNFEKVEPALHNSTHVI